MEGDHMNSNWKRVFVTGAAAIAIGAYAEIGFSVDNESGKKDPVEAAVAKGLKWLVSTQGKNGGWGQDGGETTYLRQGERLESNGNDVANTAVVVEALLHSGTTPTTGENRRPLMNAAQSTLKRLAQRRHDGRAR